MKHRLFLVGILLAAAIVVVGGIASCQKAASVRQSQATATEVPLGGETTPASGPTVVSAVTPTPGIQGQQTPGEVPATTIPLASPAPPTVEPAPTQATTTGTGGQYVLYKVKQGDTVASIAAQYGTTITAVANLNGLTDPSLIVVGQELKIPTSGATPGQATPGSAGGTPGCRVNYTVQRGDWVWQIARDYGVSPYDILKANGLTIQSANTIQPGQVLCIP
jgi:LysM repeat protein